MSKFTESQDWFLIEHYEGVGADIIANHDMPHSAAAIRRRVKRLKESGAWECLIASRKLTRRASVLMKLPMADFIREEILDEITDDVFVAGMVLQP